MADDKRDGSDDLFEDLDKFFAPIQDVDWPEPDEAAAPASTPSAEEHVAVHVEPGAPTPAEEQDPIVVSTDDDAAWYDTDVLETFDVTDDEPSVGAHAPTQGQASLLSGDDAGAADDDWPGEDASDAAPEVAPEVAPEFGREDTSVSPAMAELMAAEPTPEDLEAAAEHFAGSVRDEAGAQAETSGVAMPFEDEPLEGELVSVVPADGGDDLFGDLAGGGEAPPGMGEDNILGDLEESGAPRTVKVGSEGLGGPSWQEPTSVEVGADIDRRGPNAGERDVPAAFLTGLVLAGIALGSLLIGDALFALLAAAVVLLAQGELYGVLHKHHLQPATAVGLSTGALIMAAAYYKGEGAMLAMFGLGVVATFLWFLAVPAAHRKNLVANMGLTLLGVAYIPVLAGYVLLTLKLPDGDSLVITVIALTLVFDTAAFLGGSVFGGVQIQRPLAPATSPKKSWEGTILATAATVLCAAIAKSFVTSLGDAGFAAFGLGLVVAVAATFGDLAESLVKRDMGIKDMSSVLPGHGGVLDRIDSVLFVAPAAFLFFRIIFL
jgi:phosphatidate cytidylyltransferase